MNKLEASAKFATLALTLLICAIFQTSLKVASGQQPQYGGTLVIGTPSEPSMLNPDVAGGGWANDIVGSAIFNALMTEEYETLKLRPDLAESWEISPDNLAYTFHLREDVKWHDGTSFTSADVLYSYNLAIKYSTISKIYLEAINEVETPDPYTVIFKTAYPSPIIMYALGAFHLYIASPEHLYEGTDETTNPLNYKPIGTGPYKFEEWVKGDHITVVKNENYFKEGLPYIDKIIFRFISDPAVLVSGLETGEINFIPWQVPLSEKKRLETLTGISTFTDVYPGSPNDLLGFNFLRPISANKTVRHAIAHAINTTDVFLKGRYGTGFLATGPVGPSVFNKEATPLYTDEYNTLELYPYDPEMANMLLDEAGYPKGTDGIRFEWECRIYPVGEFYLKEAEVIKSYLEDVGIKLKIVTEDYTAFWDSVGKKANFDVFVGSMDTGYPADAIAKNYYSSSGITRTPWSNVFNYSNPRVDWLLNQSLTTTNLAKRQEYMAEYQQILVDELPAVWIGMKEYLHASKDTIHGPYGWQLFSSWWGKYYEEMWIEQAQPTPSEGVPDYVWIAAIVIIIGIVGSIGYYLLKKPRKI